MKINKKKIALSLATCAILSASTLSADITINDTNTTGIVTTNTKIAVTSTGIINVTNKNAIHITDEMSGTLIKNEGNIVSTATNNTSSVIKLEEPMINKSQLHNSGNITLNNTNSGSDFIKVISVESKGYGSKYYSIEEGSNIINSGVIKVDVNNTGDNNNNIVGIVTEGAIYGKVINSKTIDISLLMTKDDVSRSGNVDAILIADEDNEAKDLSGNGSIMNTGTINLSSDVTNLTPEIKMNGIRVDDIEDNASIQLIGTMNLTAKTTSKRNKSIIKVNGVYVEDDILHNSFIQNRGTINITSDLNNTNGDSNSELNLRGIYVKDDINGTSFILNDGNININSLITADEINKGEISGIDVSGILKDDTKVTNNGNIVINQTSSSYTDVDDGLSLNGININDMNGTSAINNGKIQIKSDIKAYSTGINIGQDGTLESTDNSTITNKGDIDIETASSVGIFTYNELKDSNVTNEGTIKLNSIRGYGIATKDISGESKIINKNNITITAKDFAVGIYNLSKTQGNAQIINEGKIDLSSGGSSHGIQTSDLLDSSQIINKGTINVDGNSTSKGIFSNFSHDSTGTITNSGTIKATVKNALDKSGYSLHIEYPEAGPSIAVTNSGTLSGNLKGFINLTNTGTTQLPFNANGEVKAQVRNYTQSADGILKIAVENESTKYSQLHAKENMTLADKTTIDVDVLASLENQKLLMDENLIDVLSAGDTLTANINTLNITDNSALLKFEAYQDDNKSINLAIKRARTTYDSVITEETLSAVGAARVLDQFIESNNANFSEVINKLNQLETTKQVADAVNSMAPVSSTATPSVNSQVVNTISSVIQTRQVGSSGLNSGDQIVMDKNLWVKPYATYSKQQNIGQKSGYTVKTKGFAVGIDKKKREKTFGAAFFYTSSDLDVNDVNQDVAIKSFNLIGYGDIPIVDDKTKLSYEFGFGVQNTDSTRGIALTNSTARADYQSKSFMVKLRAARSMDLIENISSNVALKTSYSYYKTPSYTESGAGALNLNVDSSTSSEFIVGVESDFEYRVNDSTNILARFGLGYDINNEASSISSSFQGNPNTSFKTEGLKNDAYVIDAGFGAGIHQTNNIKLNFMYDYNTKGTTFENHTVSAKFNWQF